MNKRNLAIDLFRGLTMALMVFVNDFWAILDVPHWMEHFKTMEDGMGLSDIVYPMFLFAMGMSVPYPIERRYAKGYTGEETIRHIFSRTVALLLMGAFIVNSEAGVAWNKGIYWLLMVAGFFLVWNQYPKDFRPAKGLRIAGTVLLTGLALAYRSPDGGLFRSSWWGILGLIGWAYLPCALAFLFLKGDFSKLTGFWLLTLLLCVLNASPAIPAGFSVRAVILGFWPGGWTHPALCASGMFTSLLLIRFGDKPRNLVSYFFTFALAMFLLGMLSHRYWIISKIQATPTWLFFCVAVSVALFDLLYWIADVKARTRWARPIAPAGTATLTCYTIPYIWYAVQQLLGLHWPDVLTAGIPGLLKALAFSFVIIGLTWTFGKIHLKLKI